MTDGSLTVYDGNGKKKYPDEGGDTNVEVQSDWTAGRRLILKQNSGEILLRCYVRAHTGNHVEQLYFQFETNTAENLFERFGESINTDLIDRFGWKIEDTPKNGLFREIARFSRDKNIMLPTEKIATLLGDNQKIQAFTSDHSQAIYLINDLIGEDCDVTIAEDSDALKYCDVGIVLHPQYQSKISLSEENESYYHEKLAAIKRRQLSESLSTTVQNFRSELGEDTLIEALNHEISDTKYQLRRAQQDPDTGDTDHSQTETDIEQNTSVYPTLSYGINGIVGLVILLYFIEFTLGFVGISLANTVGTEIDTLALTLVVFITGYGSLAAASTTSNISRDMAVMLGGVSILLSGVLAVAVISFDSIRAILPSTIAGLPWWISLAFLPPILGAIEILRSQQSISGSESQNDQSSILPSKYAVAAGVGMLGGFIIKTDGIWQLYTFVNRGGTGIWIGAGVVTFLLFSGIAVLLVKDTYTTPTIVISTIIISLCAGIGISAVLFTFALPTSLNSIPLDIPVGFVFTMIAVATTEHINQSTTMFEPSQQLEISKIDGKENLVKGPKFSVEGYNKTDVKYVTIELLRNNKVIDNDIVETGTQDAPIRFVGNLVAERNGEHTIKAYTGQGEFSGDRGGKDSLEVSIKGIKEITSSQSQSAKSQGSNSEQKPLQPSEEISTSASSNIGTIQDSAGDKQSKPQIEDASKRSRENDQNSDSEEDSEQDNSNWDYTL